MLAALIPALAPIVEKLVGLIPDPNERERAKAQLERDISAAANKAMEGQVEINKIEAGHASLFVAGWRPFIGWVCGAGLAVLFVLGPLLDWAVSIAMTGYSPIMPRLAADNLLELVIALLGLGAYRSFEKVRGVSPGPAPVQAKPPAPASGPALPGQEFRG